MTVTVYFYRHFDPFTSQVFQGWRAGTRKAIEDTGDEPIEETAHEVEDHELDALGFVKASESPDA